MPSVGDFFFAFVGQRRNKLPSLLVAIRQLSLCSPRIPNSTIWHFLSLFTSPLYRHKSNSWFRSIYFYLWKSGGRIASQVRCCGRLKELGLPRLCSARLGSRLNRGIRAQKTPIEMFNSKWDTLVVMYPRHSFGHKTASLKSHSFY